MRAGGSSGRTGPPRCRSRPAAPPSTSRCLPSFREISFSSTPSSKKSGRRFAPEEKKKIFLEGKRGGRAGLARGGPLCGRGLHDARARGGRGGVGQDGRDGWGRGDRRRNRFVFAFRFTFKESLLLVFLGPSPRARRPRLGRILLPLEEIRISRLSSPRRPPASGPLAGRAQGDPAARAAARSHGFVRPADARARPRGAEGALRASRA